MRCLMGGDVMLCCLVGALLAGNLLAAWRLVAARATPSARRAALVALLCLAPLGAAAALANGGTARSGKAPSPDEICFGSFASR
ncbi:hypothetical protein IHQ68_05620 [Chelatococcus sambhunathii]|uniref:Uncharacterized protein n=1 Tax=Chelatococcus sambhunathii TaxID=363953 RepID=A0ABU1DDF6_9HYPH|nr:hypothetical protein [Chelatococcus sambhunathii]MDR4306096.1 hypothetical protein [Chelatococcus sambhunathii]